MSDFGLFLLLFAALLGAVALIRFFAWLTDVREAGGPVAYARQARDRYVRVKDNAEQSAPLMSRAENESAGLWLSDLRQTAPQTPDQTAQPTYNRAGMIDIYRLMRKYTIPREEARAAFRTAGLPLDNNVWAAAAPAEPARLTPIAGRPTSAVFETDPDFPYVTPPA